MEEDNDSSGFGIGGREVLYSLVAMALFGGLMAKKNNRKQAVVRDLVGLHAVVTGANCGIGKEVVRGLAARGASVIVAVRNKSAGIEAADEICKDLEGCERSNLKVEECDLSSFSSIEKFTNLIKDTNINVLINNAGTMHPSYDGSKHNTELNMLTNFIGPLYLTSLLIPSLKKASQEGKRKSRIVNVSSRLEKNTSWTNETFLNTTTELIDDAVRGNNNQTEEYNTWKTYANSKIAQLMCTRYQASVLDDIKVHAVTPGFCNTNLSRYANPVLLFLTAPIRPLFIRSSEDGALPVLYAATGSSPDEQGPELAKSGYYGMDSKGFMIEAGCSELSKDASIQKLIFEASMKIIQSEKDKSSTTSS